MKECALLSLKVDRSHKSMPAKPAVYAYQCSGYVLAVPEDSHPRDLILALRELEKMAIEDYLRRTADGGGT